MLPKNNFNIYYPSLQGDTFAGYLSDENEVEALLNLYKKETTSLFSTRQTPSPGRDEHRSPEAVGRLMWKSQYVPYDGIPFLNIGVILISLYC